MQGAVMSGETYWQLVFYKGANPAPLQEQRQRGTRVVVEAYAERQEKLLGADRHTIGPDAEANKLQQDKVIP